MTFFAYDPDVEDHVLVREDGSTAELIMPILRLIDTSERFRAAFLYLLTGTFEISLTPWVVKKALEYYDYYSERLVPVYDEGVWEFLGIKPNQLDFHTIDRVSSIGGYNLGTVEIAEYEGYYVFSFYGAAGPDDYFEAHFLAKEPIHSDLVDFQIYTFIRMKKILEEIGPHVEWSAVDHAEEIAEVIEYQSWE